MIMILILIIPVNTAFGWWIFGNESDNENNILKDEIVELKFEIEKLQNNIIWLEKYDNDENKVLKDTTVNLKSQIKELKDHNTNFDNEKYCSDLFADMYDWTYDMMFYSVIFDIMYESDFNENNIPVNLYESLMYDLESIKTDGMENQCGDYTYLLEENEYLKWRSDNFEYHVELSEYHNTEYHQQSKVGQYLDEIKEHKELIKFFLPLVFGL